MEIQAVAAAPTPGSQHVKRHAAGPHAHRSTAGRSASLGGDSVAYAPQAPQPAQSINAASAASFLW